MRRFGYRLGAILVLALLVGCDATNPPAATPPTPPPTGAVVLITDTPKPPATDAPTPLATDASLSSPSETPTPRPTATWVPTLPASSPAPISSPPAELLAAMDAIEVEVAFLRGLDETSPIKRTLMTREELAAYLEQEFAEEYSDAEIEADVRVLAAFDFVPRDFELLSLLLDLYSDQVVGLYDDEQDTLYVVTDVAAEAGSEASAESFDLLARITFAHEFTHGLQDQHFGLDTFIDEDEQNDDQVLARMSLVEGDASLAMTQYLMAHLFDLAPEDLGALQDESLQGSQGALASAPPIIRETFQFPYLRGLEFVSALHEKGWEAVDAAFADPPQSTEQILHPEKYLSRDEPQVVSLPPLTDTLGAGWHLVEAETLGEFQTGLYLAQQVDQATADVASQGWDGDQYALYARDGGEVLVFATAWDSQEDQEEFVAAYRGYAEGKYGQAATRSGESELWWEMPTQAAVLAWGEPVVLIVLGPDPATVEKVLAAIR